MSLRVTIEDRNPDGRGRGPAGERTALISQAHPGETVILRPDRHTKFTVQGRVKKILEADPRRIEHPCSHEHACTGCPMLAAHPEDEGGFKAEKVRAALEEGGLDSREAAAVLRPLEVPAGPFHYRHYAKQVFTLRQGKVVLGSYVAGTHRVVDNTACPVLVPPLAGLLDEIARRADRLKLPVHVERPVEHLREKAENVVEKRSGRRGKAVGRPAGKQSKAVENLRRETGRGGQPGRGGLRFVLARHSRATGRQLVVLVSSLVESRADPGLVADYKRLVTGLARRRGVAGVELRLNAGPGNALLAGEIVFRAGAESLEEELAGFRHRIGPDTFFQSNPTAAEVLVRRAVEAAGSGAFCLEAFAGAGALTLPLARRFTRVQAVERGEAAVEALRGSARRAGLAGKVEAVNGRAETVLPRRLEQAGRKAPVPDAIVLDPPRKGLGETITDALAALAARCRETGKKPRLVLLSCDPTTLARDLPPLLAAGYRVRRVSPVDQFPRTGQVETVTLLD